MKLNHDCVRDTMLYLENNLELNERTESYFIASKLNSFEIDDVIYSIRKLVEADYISANPISTIDGPSYIISALTWQGHQFLDNVREPDVWSKAKSKASVVGQVSIPILSQVASSVITKALGL